VVEIFKPSKLVTLFVAMFVVFSASVFESATPLLVAAWDSFGCGSESNLRFLIIEMPCDTAVIPGLVFLEVQNLYVYNHHSRI